jgi:capsular polysaccharide biosynthesis protein
MPGLLTLPFVTQDAYAEWANAPRRVVYEAEEIKGPPPMVFPEGDRAFFGEAPLSYRFPAVSVTTLRHVVVRGKSNVLTPPEAIVRHGLYDAQREVLPEHFYARLMIVSEEGVAWAPHDPFAVDYIPEAAAFTDCVAYNYAHWLTEVLPRIVAFVRDAPATIPLILDTDLHPNLLRSVEMVAPGFPIHRLGANELVRVGVLHNVSPAGYVPFKLKPQPPAEIQHGLFSRQALTGAVGALRAAIPGADAGGARPKYVIRRNSALRKIPNETVVEDALVARGFVPLEPERLSFDEQVVTYSNAGMVVGATGAALANLVFCRPDCPIVPLTPKFLATAFWYWRRMSAGAGAGPVVYVSGPQTTPLEDQWDGLAAHQDFEIQVADVLDAVDAAEAL